MNLLRSRKNQATVILILAWIVATFAVLEATKDFRYANVGVAIVNLAISGYFFWRDFKRGTHE